MYLALLISALTSSGGGICPCINGVAASLRSTSKSIVDVMFGRMRQLPHLAQVRFLQRLSYTVELLGSTRTHGAPRS